MINPNPIEAVYPHQIGARVSYMIAGMARPKMGAIVGLSTIPGKTWVKIDGEPNGVLFDLYDLQWVVDRP